MSYPTKNLLSDLYLQIWIEAGEPGGWFQTRNGIRCAVGLPDEHSLYSGRAILFNSLKEY
jgi:hypothetical protein